jgi:guanylate kinase
VIPLSGRTEPSPPSRRGLMLVLSSPSGAGKSTLTRSLLKSDPNLDLSISVTTRKRRHSEIDGQHYHFIDAKRFARMREAGELLESAEVHGNHYGTPREFVEAALKTGRDVVFDIDWQGTQQLAAQMPDDLVRIFVLPPTMAELKARLERRAEDDSDVIARRLAAARNEIAHWGEYDYVIVNDDLDRSLRDVQAILAAERLKRVRQPGIEGFISRLLSE